MMGIMNARKLLVITSATAGSQNDITDDIKKLLESAQRDHQLISVTKPPELKKVMQRINLEEFEAVAVYGGDGTVIAAIKIFGKKQLPILILPGGTANILAGYYNVPPAIEALEQYLKDTLIIIRSDIATVNDNLLVLDMHAGWWTESIKETPRKLKKKIGPSAYAWSALQKVSTAPLQKYEFTLNGKTKHTTTGYTFLIANQGNQNVLGLPIFPRDHAPGMVQMAIIKSVRAKHLLKWFLRRLVGKDTPSVIQIYRARKILITKSPQYILADDASKKVSLPLEVVAGKYTAKLLVPPVSPALSIFVKAYRWLELWLHRLVQRARTLLNSGPNIRYSHVAPNLYLGGKYQAQTYNLFREWGITGVVSMRKRASAPTPNDIEVLSLPTQDWMPPKVEDLQKGVEFINKKIAAGGSVYVHCRLGEGRGPTMAAAYLISNGFTIDEALAQLKKYRPVARPNARQRKRLAEFQQAYNSEES